MKVYFVDNSWDAKIKVYEVENSWDADQRVTTVDHSWDGGIPVYRVQNSWDADLKIYVEEFGFDGMGGDSPGYGPSPYMPYCKPPKVPWRKEISSGIAFLAVVVLKWIVGIYSVLALLATLLCAVGQWERKYLVLYLIGGIIGTILTWKLYKYQQKML